METGTPCIPVLTPPAPEGRLDPAAQGVSLNRSPTLSLPPGGPGTAKPGPLGTAVETWAVLLGMAPPGGTEANDQNSRWPMGGRFQRAKSQDPMGYGLRVVLGADW